jgi:predicted RNase H-like HicB family nuclease
MAKTMQGLEGVYFRATRAGGGSMRFTAVFQQVPEGFVAFVEELPGANTQGATLVEARANLADAVELVLEANRALAQESIKGQDVIREPFDITAQ